MMTHAGVGDLVFLLPTIYALRESLSNVRIGLPVFSRGQGHLASAIDGTLVDKVFYDCRFADLIRAVRQFAPQLYFEFDGGFRYAVAGWVASPARRIHPPREFVKGYAAMLHSEALPHRVGEHRVDTMLSLLGMIGLKRKRVSFEFDVPDRHIENAALLAERYIPDGSIAVIPAAGVRCKNWPAESLQRTIDILSRDLGRNVVVIGRDQCPGLRNATDLAGKSNFLTDAYLLRYSGLFDVVVGVDTGMMQIAGSVSSDANGEYGGVAANRTVSLFGPTDPRVYKPYDPTGGFNLVVKPAKPSSSMSAVGWARDTAERPYMKELDPQEIVGTLTRHFDRKAAWRPAVQARA